jgi:hypothetical protein
VVGLNPFYIILIKMRNDNNLPPPKFVSPLGPSLYQPPQQTNSPTFKQNVKEGFAVGLGASVARNIVDRIFSPSSPNPSNTSPPSPSPSTSSCILKVPERCFPEKQSFDTCIKENRDIKMCELTIKVYHDCLDSYKINGLP